MWEPEDDDSDEDESAPLVSSPHGRTRIQWTSTGMRTSSGDSRTALQLTLVWLVVGYLAFDTYRRGQLTLENFQGGLAYLVGVPLRPQEPPLPEELSAPAATAAKPAVSTASPPPPPLPLPPRAPRTSVAPPFTRRLGEYKVRKRAAAARRLPEGDHGWR